MSNRSEHADEHMSLGELIETTTHPTKGPTDTKGQTLAILASTHRVVLSNGRVSGGRACALSARAARRGILAVIPRP
jgi:hypothetical protein